MLGSIPSRWVMKTRCNRAEVVFLRSKANLVSSFMNPSVRTQSINARVFNEGEAGGFDNKAERKCNKSVLHSIINVLRAGKDDR